MSEFRGHALEPEAVLERLGGNAYQGLSDDLAAQRLKELGPNLLEEVGRESPWRLFADQFREFMVLVLIGAAVVSGILQEWIDAIAILAIVILNAILGFVQQYQAERALEALKKMAAPLAMVLRGGKVRSVPAEELVPGDIILAVAGKSTKSVAALLSALDDHRIGDQVDVRVWRSGRVAEFPVILEPGD